MSIELVYRLRTCAAALVDGRGVPTTETVDLLVEASNLLDIPQDLGEPMEMLSPRPIAQWGGGQMNATARPCPNCGAISARTVRRNGRKLMLTCPECSSSWEYGHG